MPFPRSILPLVALLAGVAAAAAAAAAGDVDLAGSRVYVFVGKKGLGHDHAVSGSLQAGSIRLDAGEQAGTLVFDMRSFRADTADARRALGLPGETDPGTQRQVTENMLGPDVLDVARHPAATLEIRSALPATRAVAPGRRAYDLAGVFTLHGVSRPVVIPAEVERIGAIDRLSGGFAIRQTDFGMRPYTKLGGVVGVADELRIYGDIRVAAAGAPAAPPSAAVAPPPAAGVVR